jgi:hypothetical protein
MLVKPFSDVYTFPNINITTFIVNIVNYHQAEPFNISINFELNLFDFKFYEVFNDFFSNLCPKAF